MDQNSKKWVCRCTTSHVIVEAEKESHEIEFSASVTNKTPVTHIRYPYKGDIEFLASTQTEAREKCCNHCIEDTRKKIGQSERPTRTKFLPPWQEDRKLKIQSQFEYADVSTSPLDAIQVISDECIREETYRGKSEKSKATTCCIGIDKICTKLQTPTGKCVTKTTESYAMGQLTQGFK